MSMRIDVINPQNCLKDRVLLKKLMQLRDKAHLLTIGRDVLRIHVDARMLNSRISGSILVLMTWQPIHGHGLAFPGGSLKALSRKC